MLFPVKIKIVVVVVVLFVHCRQGDDPYAQGNNGYAESGSPSANGTKKAAAAVPDYTVDKSGIPWRSNTMGHTFSLTIIKARVYTKKIQVTGGIFHGIPLGESTA